MKQKPLTNTRGYVFGFVTAEVEVSERFQPSPLSHWSSEIPAGHFTNTGPSLWPIIRRLSPIFPFHALITSGVLVKAQESRKPVTQNSKTKQKNKKSPLEHLLYIVIVNFSFIRLQIALFFTWKGDTKIWLCYRRREKVLLLQSLSSVWEFLFSPTCRSERSSCCKLCSHPQNGTSQLE